MKNLLRLPAALLCGLFLAACGSIGTYDQAAYANAVSVKVDTLDFMDKAGGAYESHTADLAVLNHEIEKAYQYDLGRPLNHTTMQMWDLILKIDPAEPKSGIWPRFLAKWQSNGRLSPDYINEKKQNLSDAIDTVIALESGKIHPSEVSKP